MQYTIHLLELNACHLLHQAVWRTVAKIHRTVDSYLRQWCSTLEMGTGRLASSTWAAASTDRIVRSLHSAAPLRGCMARETDSPIVRCSYCCCRLFRDRRLARFDRWRTWVMEAFAQFPFLRKRALRVCRCERSSFICLPLQPYTYLWRIQATRHYRSRSREAWCLLPRGFGAAGIIAIKGGAALR